MPTTALADLNNALSQEILARTTELTVADQIPNNRHQSQFDAGRLIKLDQYELDTTKETLDAEPTGIDYVGGVRDFKTITVIGTNRKSYSIDKFIESHMGYGLGDRFFGSAELPMRVNMEQVRAMARDRDEMIFDELFSIAGNGTSGTGGAGTGAGPYYGTAAADYLDDDGRTHGALTGNGDKADFLFEVIRNLRNRAIKYLYSTGSNVMYPLIVVADPFMVDAARDWWESQKLTSVTPNLNEQLITENRFGLTGFEFSYRGVMVLQSKLLGDETPTGVHANVNGKDYWRILGAVGQIGSTIINGPGAAVDLGLREYQKTQFGIWATQSWGVESERPNALFKWFVRKEA